MSIRICVILLVYTIFCSLNWLIKALTSLSLYNKILWYIRRFSLIDVLIELASVGTAMKKIFKIGCEINVRNIFGKY